MRIKGAIFDLDGTLLDSMFLWDTVGEDYLRSRAITPEPGLNEIFKTMSLVQAAEYYRAHYGIADSVQEIMDGVNRRIEHFYADVVQPKAGVLALLEQFRARGIPLCIATATDRYMVEAALRRNGIAEFFCAIFTCTEVGAGKDSPVIFERALARLGTKKEETVVFEDALYAIRTAKAAGFPVVGIYDASAQGQQDAIREIADRTVRSFENWSE